jgi:hypothetical protein
MMNFAETLYATTLFTHSFLIRASKNLHFLEEQTQKKLKKKLKKSCQKINGGSTWRPKLNLRM